MTATAERPTLFLPAPGGVEISKWSPPPINGRYSGGGSVEGCLPNMTGLGSYIPFTSGERTASASSQNAAEAMGRGAMLKNMIGTAAQGVAEAAQGAWSAGRTFFEGTRRAWENMSPEAKYIIKGAGGGALSGVLAELESHQSSTDEKPLQTIAVLKAGARGALQGGSAAAIEAGVITERQANRYEQAGKLAKIAMRSRFPETKA